MLDFLSYVKDFREEIYIFSFILFAILFEYYFRRIRKKIKKELHNKYGEITESNNGNFLEDEFYIDYYKKIQIIDLVRIIIVISIVFIIILYKSPSAFSFLAIAAGAIIITFKEVILSFLGFFLIITNYKIGDVIRVGDFIGEIIYIKPLFVGAIGKDKNGEHNGQFYVIPNSKFILDIVIKEEIKMSNFQREHIDIYFSKNVYGIEFSEFKNKLTKYLDKKLETKTIDDVGNYKTYIGYKYKMRFNYDKDFLIIKLTFIEKPINSLVLREEIITYIESLKK